MSETVCGHCGKPIQLIVPDVPSGDDFKYYLHVNGGQKCEATHAEPAPARQPRKVGSCERCSTVHTCPTDCSGIVDVTVAASPAEGPRQEFDPPCRCAIRNSRIKQGVIGPHHEYSCPQYGGVRPENEPQRMAKEIPAAQPSPDVKVDVRAIKAYLTNVKHWNDEEIEEFCSEFLRPYFPADATQKVDKSKYFQLLRWFKLFYGFFQEDVKGRPSAAASALSEDGELQEFVKEAYEKYPDKSL